MPVPREHAFRWTPTPGSAHGNRVREDFASAWQSQGSEERASCSLACLATDEAAVFARMPPQNDHEVDPASAHDQDPRCC